MTDIKAKTCTQCGGTIRGETCQYCGTEYVLAHATPSANFMYLSDTESISVGPWYDPGVLATERQAKECGR